MAFWKEFKTFAMKGNVMDMAVGVIIGGAFGKIVSSLVNDVLMPPISALIGSVNLKDLRLDLSGVRDVVNNSVSAVADVVGASEAVMVPSDPIYWNYGAFIQQCIDFLILALCVFLMIRIMNRLMRKNEPKPAPAPAPAPEPAPTKEEILLTEIRDLLAQKRD
ncbi:MAG: large-conductance mechanosensitive channel protein MscL [Tidjanibacter sp.]|nr:large-conductance mechanosensitive channel protein MscL [Tidjanibacter sp.]